MRYITRIDERQYEIEINADDEITVDGERLSADFQSVANQPIYSLILDGESYEASVRITPTGVQVLLKGQLFDASVEDERQRRIRQSTSSQTVKSGDYHLRAPMPGLVIDIPVKEGQEIEVGQNLVILESMKMQNELKAPREGTVSRVLIKPGDSIEHNQIMMTIS